MMENKKILELLRELREDSETLLVENVISIVLDECEDEPKTYIKNVLEHGCVSGVVSALIYYSDTKKFFTENMDDIFDLYNECYEENGVIPLPNERYELNFNSLSWFAFEETLYRIANNLELDY